MELSVSMYPRELQPHLQELLCRVVTGSTGAGAAVPGTTQESNNPPKAELGSGGRRKEALHEPTASRLRETQSPSGIAICPCTELL